MQVGYYILFLSHFYFKESQLLIQWKCKVCPEGSRGFFGKFLRVSAAKGRFVFLNLPLQSFNRCVAQSHQGASTTHQHVCHKNPCCMVQMKDSYYLWKNEQCNLNSLSPLCSWGICFPHTDVQLQNQFKEIRGKNKQTRNKD